MRKLSDRVGLGWRPELAAGILSNLDSIDIVEVIADDYFDARGHARSLKTLAAYVPIVLHGISLGMASTSRVDRKRLEKMARVIDMVEPECWSEHLAFVRAGDIEIGHLSAPPRTSATIDATAVNLDHAREVVGSAPLVENIATLIDPPASDRDEATWLTQTLAASGASLLLDLHNLYANSINFGMDPHHFLSQIPMERIHAVHISGGKWIQDGSRQHSRILDDHLHDPPDPVYDLLSALVMRCPNPLTVILERDGSYPPIGHLLAQLTRARRALDLGRARQAA